MTLVALDLNGLKAANDQSGHAAGAALRRRAGEVLGKLADKREFYASTDNDRRAAQAAQFD